MTFHGKETTPPAPKPVRTFMYTDFGGRLRTVEASYVKFTSAHVCFWKDRPGEEDLLVMAESNNQVHGLRETP